MPGARSVSLDDLVVDVALSSPARGDLAYFGLGNFLRNLPPGADGRVLTTHGAGADPTWEVGGGSDPTKLPLAGGTLTGRVKSDFVGSATDDETSNAFQVRAPSGVLANLNAFVSYANFIASVPTFEVDAKTGFVGIGTRAAVSYPFQVVNVSTGLGTRLQTLASTPANPGHDWIMGAVEMVVSSADAGGQAGVNIGAYSNHPIFFSPNLTKRFGIWPNGEIRQSMMNAVPDLNLAGAVAPNSSGVFYVDPTTEHVMLKLKNAAGVVKTLDLGAPT